MQKVLEGKPLQSYVVPESRSWNSRNHGQHWMQQALEQS